MQPGPLWPDGTPAGPRNRLPQPPLRFAPRGPWSSRAGLLALLAVFASAWRVPGLRITLQAGLPWLVVISLCYVVWSRLQRGRHSAAN